MTEQLELCPFCQGQAELLLGAHDFNGAEVQCKECGASSGHFENDAKGKGATAHWNHRAQPAQAVPLLSRDEVDACFGGLMPSGSGKSQYDIACQIEQAVRAKLGEAVPMTDEQISEVLQSPGLWLLNPTSEDIFRAGARWAEKMHGIVGKEGGNV